MGTSQRAVSTSVVSASAEPFMFFESSLQSRLPRTFYDRPTATVARELLGKTLLRRTENQWLGGIIVETEAYLSADDPASHSVRGLTKSNASMFGPPGTLYVYPIHAKYCLNAVTEPEGHGAAVLIRALQPRWGIGQMMVHRGTEVTRKLTSGPAMLCQALSIDRRDDGTDLVRAGDIAIVETPESLDHAVTEAVRVGISQARDRELRFFFDGNPFVSGRRSDHKSWQRAKK